MSLLLPPFYPLFFQSDDPKSLPLLHFWVVMGGKKKQCGAPDFPVVSFYQRLTAFFPLHSYDHVVSVSTSCVFKQCFFCDVLYGAPFGKKLFCDACFFHLFRPQFVRYIYRKYPTYISDKLYPKSDQKTRAKYVGYFRLIYRTNCALSRTKNTRKISRTKLLVWLILSDMVHMSYLRQNLEVSRDFRDEPRKKQKS